MREALLWVQTKEEAKVYFEYYEIENPKKRYKTESCSTNIKSGFVAKLIANNILPGKKYAYQVYINGKEVNINYPLEFQSQALWQWRTDPPEVNFAIGSCMYVNEPRFDRPGRPYGSNYEIFTSIYKKNPDFIMVRR